MNSLEFYGDKKCTAVIKGTQKPCNFLASYQSSTKNTIYFCKVHCRYPSLQNVKVLPRRNQEQQEQFEMKRNNLLTAEILKQQKDNQEAKRPGNVDLYLMKMRQHIEYKPGYRYIFPNKDDENRNDGVGFPQLSPFNLGPIQHNQPGLPICETLEAYHQFSKFYPNWEDKQMFVRNQIDAFSKKETYRHKCIETAKEFLSNNPITGALNEKLRKGEKRKREEFVPEYSVFIDEKGQEHHIGYVESRQFYSNWYERLVKDLKEFKLLQLWKQNGMNLVICGYEAENLKNNSLEETYLDPKHKWGHELVLFSMLTESDESKWPWRIHKTYQF